MERDVYNLLLEKLSEIKDTISGAIGVASDVATLQEDVGTLTTNIGGFKIETFDGVLDNTTATNVFETGITYNNHAVVGISVNNVVRASTADAIVNYTFDNTGALTITKANASWGGTNAIKVTVIHD